MSLSFPFSMRPGRLAAGWESALLVAMHVAGIAGLAWPASRPLFLVLTPFHLAAMTGWLLLRHSPLTRSDAWLLGSITGIGWGVEVIGVQTGQPFGTYAYSGVFGPAVLGVPLLIGLNWLLLFYLSGALAGRLFLTAPAQALGAAVLMVFLDVIIEPAAIDLAFWHWQAGTPPLRNYLAWFGVALLMHGLARWRGFAFRSPVAPVLLACQAGFFLALNLLLA